MDYIIQNYKIANKWSYISNLIFHKLEIERRYFANLDGLRFILAFMVFASHCMIGERLCQLIPVDFFQRLIKTFSSGDLGVSFFFVLSGFLITYQMFEEKASTGKFNTKNFYIRRIFRIWPLYFCVLIFTFFIYPLIKGTIGYTDQNPYNVFYHALFLANFDSISVNHANLTNVAPLMIGINWSISVEEQFYLVWPLLFKSTAPRKFWLICAALVLTSWIFRIYTRDEVVRYFHTFGVVCDLAMGGLCAYLSFFSKSFISSIEKLNKPLIILGYSLGMAILMYNDLLFNDFFSQTTLRLLQALFFCFVIVEQNDSKHSPFKIGNSKALSSLGKYTFALYMLHPIGIQASIILFRYAGFDQTGNFYLTFPYAGLSFLISMMLAICSYHLIERHFLKWRKLFY